MPNTGNGVARLIGLVSKGVGRAGEKNHDTVDNFPAKTYRSTSALVKLGSPAPTSIFLNFCLFSHVL